MFLLNTQSQTLALLKITAPSGIKEIERKGLQTEKHKIPPETGDREQEAIVARKNLGLCQQMLRTRSSFQGCDGEQAEGNVFTS